MRVRVKFKTGVQRADFREVRPTDAELAAWYAGHRGQRPPYRAEHKPCGKRMWYSGFGIGSHLRACPGKQEALDSSQAGELD